MIISHKHKFIFIKNRKTAGTSIEISLSKFCGSKDVITPITEEDERVRQSLGFLGPQNYHKARIKWTLKQWRNYLKNGEKPYRFYNHIPTKEIIDLLPEKIWNSYFKFTIERNPFDKAVSYYYWRKANEKYKNFSDFILDGGLDPLYSFDLYSTGKFLLIDKVYKYEDLPFFEKDISNQLNLPEPFQLIKYRAKGNSRKVHDYRNVLDKRSVELIKKLFYREIELYGYEF